MNKNYLRLAKKYKLIGIRLKKGVINGYPCFLGNGVALSHTFQGLSWLLQINEGGHEGCLNNISEL